MTSQSIPAVRRREAGNAHAGVPGRRARLPLAAGLAAVAVAGLVAGCSSGNGTASAGTGSASGTQPSGDAPITISTRPVSGVGTVLTDQSGKTLYTPQQEAQGVIKCTGGCLSFWFPVTVGSGAALRAGSGVTGTLGSIQRPDGGRQLTYNGDPLYTFRLDNAPGQVHGNNFTDQFGGQTFTWHAAASTGTAGAGTSAPSQPGSPSGYNPYPAGGSGGY
jgi:predicted lipoprotein with Yx(FWY)xxD motif